MYYCAHCVAHVLLLRLALVSSVTFPRQRRRHFCVPQFRVLRLRKHTQDRYASEPMNNTDVSERKMAAKLTSI